MTDAADYFRKIEREIRRLRALSQQSCEELSLLPVASQCAFARAVAFAGCESVGVPVDCRTLEVVETDRTRAARLMLLRMSVDTPDPRWSSWVLEKMLTEVMATPGGTVTDVLQASCDVLEEYSVELTPTVAMFLKQVTILCFTRYHPSYKSADFVWMARRVNERATPALAYLALLAIPVDILPRCRDAILTSLRGTEFWDEASRSLEEGDAMH